jgi:hypothetical protein
VGEKRKELREAKRERIRIITEGTEVHRVNGESGVESGRQRARRVQDFGVQKFKSSKLKVES